LIERTLIIIKPDGVRRGLTGPVLERFERAGLKVIALKMIKVDREFAEKHYTYEDIAVRHGEAVREQLLVYITEGPVVAVVLEGVACVDVARKIVGVTDPQKAFPGTIRGDYCHHGIKYCKAHNKAVRNVIHASATLPEAQTEIVLWFSEGELVSYQRSDENEHQYAG
jgi:nucleoside-diphosphate kinase